MSWQILRGDARCLPLADGTVDLIVSSPPYWGLRSYRDGGEHYSGQVGSEVTPAQYVDELVGMVDGEWRRVLKPSGSLFLNLGDKYASGGRSTYDHDDKHAGREGNHRGQDSARPKSLLGLPWRIALTLIDRGWILRAEIIWSKPNGLPESVTDRVRRSHEQVFHLTLNPRYYSAVDEIREEYAPATIAIYERGVDPRRGVEKRQAAGIANQGPMRGDWNPDWRGNPLGRLPGSVWTIPTSPLIIPEQAKQHYRLPDHFAAYPPELVRRIIIGWSPKGVCTVCGEGRRPVVEKVTTGHDNAALSRTHRVSGRIDPEFTRMKAAHPDRIVDEACACPTPDAPTTPGVVLDPMCGTGTTVGVAHKLGRHAIGVDLSADYCRLAEWRVEHSGHFDSIEDRSWQDRQLTLEG